MTQQEIPLPEQPKRPIVYCYCLPDDRAVVVLHNSVSPDYLIGKCTYCGKTHTQRLQ